MGMKTINLSVQHPTIKEMVTIASMDFEQENTETLCEFWRQLNEVSFFLLSQNVCSHVLHSHVT